MVYSLYIACDIALLVNYTYILEGLIKIIFIYFQSVRLLTVKYQVKIVMQVLYPTS